VTLRRLTVPRERLREDLFDLAPLPSRAGRCFACGAPAGARLRRWTGHPEGEWTGWVEACRRHANVEGWSLRAERAFARYARRRAVDPETSRRRRESALGRLVGLRGRSWWL
jgi:hypothetical protein